MKTTAAMDAILAQNNALAAQHALECALMSLGGIGPDGRISKLFDERPMGWKAAKRVDPEVVPPIERAQWAREARTFLGAIATSQVPGSLVGDQLLEAAAAGVEYTSSVLEHGILGA